MIIILKDGKRITIPLSEFPLEIEFNGKKYTIKVTKNGKLILN